MTRTGQPQMVEAAASRPGQRTGAALIAAYNQALDDVLASGGWGRDDWGVDCLYRMFVEKLRRPLPVAAVPDTAASTQPDVAETIAREIEASAESWFGPDNNGDLANVIDVAEAARIARSAAARTQPVTHDEAEPAQPETRQEPSHD